MTAYRYALYWAPAEDHPLWPLGCRWLGWDALRGEAMPAPDGIDASRWEALTAAPRRYGLHATVKAPFEPAPGVSEADVFERSLECLRGVEPFDLAGLRVAPLGDFLALRPLRREAALHDLADRVVERLDDLRRPPEQASGLPASGLPASGLPASGRPASGLPASGLPASGRPELTPSEREGLLRWGYPYVFERYRFHLSLTGPLSEPERAVWSAELESRFGPVLARPLRIDALCVFVQAAPGGRFRLARRIAFGGAGADPARPAV